MKVKHFDFGHTVNQEQVKGVHIFNESEFSVSLINWGATLTSVKFIGHNQPLEEITVNLPNIQDYEKDSPYLGSTVGRVANRIANGLFELNGQSYPLYKNDNNLNHLHGGKRALDKVIWDMVIQENRDNVEVIFSYSSKDGEEGYPGNADIKTFYRITNNNEISIRYEVKVDAPCPFAMTNHAYWNLSGNLQSDILNHQLQLASNAYLPINEQTVPTGEIVNVDNSAMDFKESTTLADGIDQTGGFDHYFVVKPNNTYQQPIARLFDPVSKRKMTIYTTQPGFQMYTGNYLDVLNKYGIKKYDGICIETHGFPDAVNQPTFPTIVLNPDEVYEHTTRHCFEIDTAG